MEVEPRFKQPRAPKKPRRSLRRVGKRTLLDLGELKNAKVELLMRSQGRCEGKGFSDLCTGYGTEMHHIVRRSQGGSNDPTNLAFLCAFCHRAVHANPAKALVEGLLKPGGAA